MRKGDGADRQRAKVMGNFTTVDVGKEDMTLYYKLLRPLFSIVPAPGPSSTISTHYTSPSPSPQSNLCGKCGVHASVHMLSVSVMQAGVTCNKLL